VGDELESDGGVDGDIAANADADKGSEDEESVVIVGCAEAETEDGRDEARHVEGPASSYTC
jgi:hypothetical protein